MTNRDKYKQAFCDIRPSAKSVERIIKLTETKRIKINYKLMIAVAAIVGLLTCAISSGYAAPDVYQNMNADYFVSICDETNALENEDSDYSVYIAESDDLVNEDSDISIKMRQIGYDVNPEDIVYIYAEPDDSVNAVPDGACEGVTLTVDGESYDPMDYITSFETYEYCGTVVEKYQIRFPETEGVDLSDVDFEFEDVIESQEGGTIKYQEYTVWYGVWGAGISRRIVV